MGIKSLKNQIKEKTLQKAKQPMKNLLFETLKTHEIILTGDGDNINVQVLGNRILPNSYIEIKHRSTGKRIEKKIKNKKTQFKVSEIVDMSEDGVLDFYIKTKTNTKVQYKSRIRYNNKNQFFKEISREKGVVLTPYSTKQDNLSLRVEKKDFVHNITKLYVNDDNQIVINGNIEVLNKKININKIVLIGRNRLDSQRNNFNMEFKEEGDNYFIFNGRIDEIKTYDENILNLRMDFYIRIYDEEIYYQNLIDLSNFKDFSNDEDRFLIEKKNENNLYSYYATQNKHSLALWITTENSFQKSYTIAKGRTIYRKTMKNTPLDKNMIFFESFFGKSYSGNPKYIYETMLKMGLDKKYTFVWSYLGDDLETIPGNPIIVRRNEADDYYEYLAKAKYWVNNIIFPIHIKRQGNVYLQTWHGTPLKKLGFDITIPGPEVEGRQNFYDESRNWDYLISSNHYSTEIFERAFKFNKEFLEVGYPINDIFFKDNEKLIDSIKSKHNLPKDKKIILYAPTWKDDEQNESWEHYFNLEIDLKRLYEEFNDEYIILLKMHHLVSERLNIDGELEKFAYDFSSYDDIQELYILADFLITDYSSVFFDYAHSKRPILFFVPDLNHYIENVRGLYLNMEKELPGPLIQNNDDLIYSIKNIDEISENFNDKYEEFYERFCSICNGDSSEKIIKELFKTGW